MKILEMHENGENGFRRFRGKNRTGSVSRTNRVRKYKHEGIYNTNLYRTL